MWQTTPLHVASFVGNESIVRELLAHPEIDVLAKNPLQERTALDYARSTNQTACVKLLENHIASAAKQKKGWSLW